MYVELQEPIFALTEAAAGLIGTGINALATMFINKRNKDEQRRVDDLNRQRALEDRAHDEAFNSPTAQRKRLEEAGLSPYAYDVATVAKTDSSSMPQSQAYQETAPDLSNAFSGFASDSQTQLQREQLAESKRQFDLNQQQSAYQFAEKMLREDKQIQLEETKLQDVLRNSASVREKTASEIRALDDEHAKAGVELNKLTSEYLMAKFNADHQEEIYKLDLENKRVDIADKKLGVALKRNTFYDDVEKSHLSVDAIKNALTKQKIDNKRDALNYMGMLVAYGMIDNNSLLDVGFTNNDIMNLNGTLKHIRNSNGDGLDPFEELIYKRLTSSSDFSIMGLDLDFSDIVDLVSKCRKMF